jgi:hypothetical protein
VYVYGYGYLDDIYCSVDSGGEDGVYIYYTKSSDGTKSAPILNLKKGNKTFVYSGTESWISGSGSEFPDQVMEPLLNVESTKP